MVGRTRHRRPYRRWPLYIRECYGLHRSGPHVVSIRTTSVPVVWIREPLDVRENVSEVPELLLSEKWFFGRALWW
jgi:hypothetical protein